MVAFSSLSQTTFERLSTSVENISTIPSRPRRTPLKSLLSFLSRPSYSIIRLLLIVFIFWPSKASVTPNTLRPLTPSVIVTLLIFPCPTLFTGVRAMPQGSMVRFTLLFPNTVSIVSSSSRRSRFLSFCSLSPRQRPSPYKRLMVTQT